MMFTKPSLILLFTIVLTCLPAWAGKKSSEQALDKEEVMAFLAKMDQEVTARDVDGLMGLIAKDVKIQITTPTAQGMQPMNFGHGDYRALMAQTFGGAVSYQVKRQDVAVTPSPDGRAVATDLLFETIRMKDREIRSISNERLVFGREGGKLKLLGLSSTVISSNE